jgi:hypothetical protein
MRHYACILCIQENEQNMVATDKCLLNIHVVFNNWSSHTLLRGSIQTNVYDQHFFMYMTFVIFDIDCPSIYGFLNTHLLSSQYSLSALRLLRGSSYARQRDQRVYNILFSCI